MYSIHSILVHIPAAADAADKTLNELTKEELTEMVINYATEETERFCGLAFDHRTLLGGEAYDEEESHQPVIFASEDWAAFEHVLLSADSAQKGYAKEMLGYLEEQTGTIDLAEILRNLLLANDRTASQDSVDPRTWKRDYLNQGSWALREVSRLIHGDYYFESGFYDTSRRTALVPFIYKLKGKPEEWALVRFDYHF